MKTPMRHQLSNALNKPLLSIFSLFALLLLNKITFADLPSTIHFKVEQFKLEGSIPISNELINQYLAPLQQRDYNLQELQKVSQGLEDLIQAQGYAFYHVSLPPQTIKNAQVILKVIAYPLDNIEIKGNSYFSKENILASIPILEKGNSPPSQAISDAVKLANKHPSKQVQLQFKQSKNPDSIDADIKVREKRPYQISLTANNFGTSSSGAYRLTGGLQYTNLWGRDHIINGNYTISPDHLNEIEQYGMNYSLPLYALKGNLTAYYANSNTSTGIIASSLNVTGGGEMYGLHYQQLLPKIGKYEHSLDLGIDNRFFSSEVKLAGNIASNSAVRSVPFSLQYRAEYNLPTVQSNYSLQWLKNTDLGEHNNQSDYNQSISINNAKQNWQLLRYNASVLFNIEQWLLSTQLIGQHSENALIGGEQFGLGGSFDIRGYAQRETSADSGEIAKIELTAPAFQQIRFFSFYDIGHGYLYHPIANQSKDWLLSSTGIGVKIQWQDYLMANITFATVLDNGLNTQTGDSRIHANIVLKY